MKKEQLNNNCSSLLLKVIVLSFSLVGHVLRCDDIYSISSAIFAVLYKIFDRHYVITNSWSVKLLVNLERKDA